MTNNLKTILMIGIVAIILFTLLGVFGYINEYTLISGYCSTLSVCFVLAFFEHKK